jgi:hypothetical protein
MTMRKPDHVFGNSPDSPLEFNRSLAAELKSNGETPFLHPYIPKFQQKLTIRAGADPGQNMTEYIDEHQNTGI